MNDASHLDALRTFELQLVIDRLTKSKSIAGRALLEVGAGTGLQARELASLGFRVEAIDVPTSNLAGQRVWPVRDYDGRRVPFADRSFDVVFSSNVLEHIAELDQFESEIARVLKDDGIVVHVVPSSSWRAWSSVSHYGHLAKRCTAVVSRSFSHGVASGRKEIARSFVVPRSFPARIARIVLPGRHGEHGNFLSEIYLFSTWHWRRHFRRTGWLVTDVTPTGIFYTGYDLAGANVTIEGRRRLARYLGSATTMFTLTKAQRPTV
jgi:ubiquinone/menaquinone biosynthesis C-methylase UbiE